MNQAPEIVARVLELLKQWGWETGYRRLEAELKADSGGDREAWEFFLGWVAAERGNYDLANSRFQSMLNVDPLAGWARAGLAFVAMREAKFPLAHRLLDEVLAVEPLEPMLKMTSDHLRGAVLYHQGRLDDARHCLLGIIGASSGPDFGTGRALDTLAGRVRTAIFN